MNLDALCLQVSHKSGISDAAGTDRNFLIQAANQGRRQVLQDTHVIVSFTFLFTLTGDSIAQIDSLVAPVPLAVLEIYHFSSADGGPGIRLSRVTAQEIHERNLAGTQGAPMYYSLMGAHNLEFSPIPDKPYELHLQIVDNPVDMAGGTDEPSPLPAWCHRAVEMWMMIEASEKLHNFDAVQYYRDEYDKECGKIRRNMRNMGGRRSAVTRAGYPGSNKSPFRNDTYPPV